MLLVGELSAQVPQAFNYQALARDASGTLMANRGIAVKISILQGSSPGALVYSERHTLTTNQFGLFTVAIGQGSVLSGTFNTITWSSGNYWLKVEMAPAGDTTYINMGIAKLLTVPFAMYAANAGGAGGVTCPTGPTGATGSQGIPGIQGEQGNPGLTGATGIQGIQGITGATGTAGTDGANGANSTVPGPTGATGASGTAGTNGTNGVNSTVPGPTGATGLTGATTVVAEVSDEFTATAAQTAFTLTQTPETNSIVKMYINGVRVLKNAYSNIGTALTYVPANNGSYVLVAGDRINFEYYK